MNGCSDEAVFNNYIEHHKAIKPKLPEELNCLQDSYTLHDAKIKKIDSHFDNREINIHALGWDYELKNRTFYDLTFKDVYDFVQTFPEGEYQESELGDIGYIEFDIDDTEIYEIRILFSSSAEFSIRFKRFSFHTISV